MNEHVPTAPVAVTAGNRAKVFVSYSRKDSAFAQMMVEALTERGFDAFLDKTDIAPGEPWKERLAALITTADTVVVAVSPDWIASTICGWELEESLRLGKRVIPVVARRITDADAPPALSRLNWVFLAEGDDKDAALTTLNTALQTDLSWVREHTRLGELAQHWDAQGRSNGSTLRGADLEAAERWLDRRPANANAPTDLHQDFIRASRRAATARQRYWVGGSLAVAIVAISLAVLAAISRHEAVTQRDRAERALTLATDTANSLVFDLTQKFRNVVGVSAATIKDILDQARKLQDQLSAAGESSSSLSRSQAAALLETITSLLEVGDTQNALAAALKAQGILQALAKDQPNNNDIQRELSVSYVKVGNVQMLQGNPSAALTSYQADLAIMNRLAKSDPGNAGWQNDLAGSYENVGDVQTKQGNLPAAMASYQASLAIADRLAKSAPDNTDWQRDLAVSYDKVGDAQAGQGNLAAALASYQASRTIRDRLAKSDPANSEWQRDLSISDVDLGDVQANQGNVTAALASYQASLAIRARLAKSDPAKDVWQSDLAVSYERIGDMQKAQRSLPAALTSYQASYAILDRLAKSDPKNAQLEHDLSVSYNKIGDIQIAQNSLPTALASYQASLAIADRLAKSAPDNTDWQRDLAVSYSKVGDTQFAQGNLASALTSYQANLAIMDGLAKSDPSNTDRQHDLMVSYEKLALADLKANQPAKAREALSAGRDIVARLVARFPDRSEWKRELALFDQLLAALKN